MEVKIEVVKSWARTFNEEETLQYAKLSGEQCRRQMERDEKGLDY